MFIYMFLIGCALILLGFISGVIHAVKITSFLGSEILPQKKDFLFGLFYIISVWLGIFLTFISVILKLLGYIN